ncbi:hypothetical protein BZM27_52215, partial [Paraburkholderia steynii]
MIGASVPAVVSVQVRATFGSTLCASHTSHSETDFDPAAKDCATRMLTKLEAAARLGIHEATLTRWVEYGLVKRHAYNDYAFLYEVPDSHPP